MIRSLAESVLYENLCGMSIASKCPVNDSNLNTSEFAPFFYFEINVV
jgi:hypothetical protein